MWRPPAPRPPPPPDKPIPDRADHAGEQVVHLVLQVADVVRPAEDVAVELLDLEDDVEQRRQSDPGEDREPECPGQHDGERAGPCESRTIARERAIRRAGYNSRAGGRNAVQEQGAAPQVRAAPRRWEDLGPDVRGVEPLDREEGAARARDAEEEDRSEEDR